jgi:hypothetical protein
MLIFKCFGPQDIGRRTTPKQAFPCPIDPDATARIFSGCDDFMSRRIAVGGTETTLTACWLDGTVSGGDVAEQVLRPLTDPARFGGVATAAEAAALLDRGAVYGFDMKRAETMDDLAAGITGGCCALVLDGTAFLYQLRTDQRRSVQEPKIEKSVKGAKDAFVETLRVNTALVRGRLRTPRLKLRQTVVGRQSRTDAAVLWLDGVAPAALPGEILRRLEGLDATEGLILPDVLDTALSDEPRSPFPQLMHTERPDKLAKALLEGRVGVLADGIPVAFIGPAPLGAFMETNEDRAQHRLPAAAIRLLRWAGLFLTLLLPALYVAVAMFHAEMIPLQLLQSVIRSKQAVPFSTPAEILGMLIAFELLQEAGLRLPDPVGQTVSIIGALIVGQSAVEARVISPIAVIVVAFAGIAGYTCPSQDLGAALRLARFGLTLAAALAGMFGLAAGLMLLLWHLASLESCGEPYLTAGRRE